MDGAALFAVSDAIQLIWGEVQSATAATKGSW